ncbi:MAG TPA: aminopeptidase [Sedimentibacter sp.]|nr:aminopeptidase [Sedimentibacter sp.]
MVTNMDYSFLYEYELRKAADILIRETCKLKEGETILITADTESDKRLVDAVAGAAFSVGGKPMVVWTSTPLGPARMVDDWLPSEAILGAALKSDAWVEFNRQYFLYSNTYQRAVDGNPKLRYLALPGTTVEVFVRLYARVNQTDLAEFVTYLADITHKAKHVRMTAVLGQDIEFDNNPEWPTRAETGFWDKPGTMMLSGQICWTPVLDSINGVIIFDASIVPQIGPLHQPVKVYVEKGVITDIEGGIQGEEWYKWLKSFKHPQMLRPAHICYGFHPGAKISGQNGEDERVWGCTEWGFGSIGAYIAPPGVPAPSHTDGITLNTTTYLDGVKIIDEGKVIEDTLVKLAAKLGK